MRLYRILWAKTSSALVQVRSSEVGSSRLSLDYLHLIVNAHLRRSQEPHLFYATFLPAIFISSRFMHKRLRSWNIPPTRMRYSTLRVPCLDIAYIHCLHTLPVYIACMHIAYYLFVQHLLIHAAFYLIR